MFAFLFGVFLATCVLFGNAQNCICIAGTSVNIRDAPCGNVIGQSNSGACYEDLGGSQVCTLGGVTYNFLEFDYSGRSGWAADDFLVAGNCPEPGVPGNCANIQRVSREEWGARPPSSSLSPLNTPVTTMYIHHTAGSQCFDQASCEATVRAIQNYHMDSNGWSDIGYSYLIGDDGRAYEGRGWEWVGAHTCCGDCNSKAVAISLMGNFHIPVGGVNPSDAMMQDIRDLIDCAVDGGIIIDWNNLNVLGHQDACSTSCPGSAVYSRIQQWSEYGRIPDPCFCY